MVKLLSTVLLLWATMSLPARADVELRIGVYAYDAATHAVWSCSSVVQAMERKVEHLLGEPFTMRVSLEADYDVGVQDIVTGRVMLARFPNMQDYWVIHPALDRTVFEAWRDALANLRVEDLVFQVADANILARQAGRGEPDFTPMVEERFGSCVDLEQRLATGQVRVDDHVFDVFPLAVPMDRLMVAGGRLVPTAGTLDYLLSDLPATAAGPPSGSDQLR